MITMKQRSIALIIAALWSAPAFAGDLPRSVYVAPGGIYIGSARVYVAPNAGNGEQAYVVPGPAYGPHYAPPAHVPTYSLGYAPQHHAPGAGYAPAHVPAYRPAPVYSARPRVYASPHAAEFVPRPPAVVPYNDARHCLMYQGRLYCD